MCARITQGIFVVISNTEAEKILQNILQDAKVIKLNINDCN